jgi:hypothetical protein
MDSAKQAGRAAEREQTAKQQKLKEAKDKGIEPIPIPVRIYQTKNQMDDYLAKDMHHGDLDIRTLKERFRIDVNTVSTKVNPRTLMEKPPLNPGPFYPRMSGPCCRRSLPER